jgi:hypothetical protein
MESSTLYKNANQEHQETCPNPYLSNPQKQQMPERNLRRRTMVEVKKLLQDLDPMVPLT